VKPYPIDEILPVFKEAACKNPSVVLQAPPGSGKTTRACLALFDVIPARNRADPHGSPQDCSHIGCWLDGPLYKGDAIK
jgi:hypothetical protein